MNSNFNLSKISSVTGRKYPMLIVPRLDQERESPSRASKSNSVTGASNQLYVSHELDLHVCKNSFCIG